MKPKPKKPVKPENPLAKRLTEIGIHPDDLTQKEWVEFLRRGATVLVEWVKVADSKPPLPPGEFRVKQVRLMGKAK